MFFGNDLVFSMSCEEFSITGDVGLGLRLQVMHQKPAQPKGHGSLFLAHLGLLGS